MKWVSTTSSTLDDTSRSHLLSVQEDEDGTWIIADRETTVYGHGRNLLEAFVDYWAALHSTLSIIEDSPCAPPLSLEARPIRHLLGMAEGETT